MHNRLHGHGLFMFQTDCTTIVAQNHRIEVSQIVRAEVLCCSLATVTFWIVFIQSPKVCTKYNWDMGFQFSHKRCILTITNVQLPIAMDWKLKDVCRWVIPDRQERVLESDR